MEPQYTHFHFSLTVILVASVIYKISTNLADASGFDDISPRYYPAMCK